MTVYKITQTSQYSKKGHTAYILAEDIEEAKQIWHFNNPYWNNPYVSNAIEESTYDQFEKDGFFLIHTKYGNLINEEKKEKAIERSRQNG